MSNPMPSGDYIPGYTPSANPGGAEPRPQGSEQPPQWSGEATPAYGSPPPQYQPYPPQFQPGQQQYQAGGAPQYPGYPPQYVPGMNPTNPLAIASMIVSIVGFGLIGVILGHIALSQINRSNGFERGRGFAIAGLIIGYAEIALGLIVAIGFLSLILIMPSSIPAN